MLDIIRRNIKNLCNEVTKNKISSDLIKSRVEDINLKISKAYKNEDNSINEIKKLEDELEINLKNIEEKFNELVNNQSKLKHEEYKLKFIKK